MSGTAGRLGVLHVIAPVRFGGGESLLVNLLGERRAGLDEQVACAYASPDFERALDRIGIAWHRLSDASLGEGVSRRAIALGCWRWPAMALRLARLVDAARADVIHVHGFPAIMLWGALRLLRRTPALYTHHFHRLPPGRLEGAVLGGLYAACAVRTGVSDLVSRSMEAAFPAAGPFLTVRNCVGAAFFAAGDGAEPPRQGGGRVVFVQPARFSPFKNQRLVVEALARIEPGRRGRIEVRFAGGGPERPAVEALARQLGVADSTTFLGAVPYADMPATIAAADFGLFPSDLEGFGVGAAECLAVGRPVLALDNPLMREVLGRGALLVAPERLAEGLAAMLERGHDLVAAARAQAEAFRPARVKDAYLALYRQAGAA